MERTLKTWDFIYEDSNGNELQRKQVDCFDRKEALEIAFNIQQNSALNDLADIRVQFIPIKWRRQCSITGEGMDEGWYVDINNDIDGKFIHYIKHKEDAIAIAKKIGYSGLQEAHDDDGCIYWTRWDDDYEYEEDENGVLTYIGE